MCQQPDMADLPHKEWKCDKCGALNSWMDAECQFACSYEDNEEPTIDDNVEQYPLWPWEE